MPTQLMSTPVRFHLALIAAGTLLLGASTPALAADSEGASGDDSTNSARTIVDYRGTLQDENGSPISGVFPLEFNFYAGVQSDKSQWRTTQWVAVTDGTYTVPLGEEKLLSEKILDKTRWLGVELADGPELVRDKLELNRGPPAAAPTPPRPEESESSDETKQLVEKAKNSQKITFADVAERAVEADRAKVADRAASVGSLTAEEIEKRSDLALERLGEHVADPDAHDAAGGPELGDRSRVMKKVGGSGGGSFRASCPEGFVVTGLRGRAGHVVDAIQIVCRKLK